MKAQTYNQANQLEDIPNIGKSIAKRLQRIGIDSPSALRGADPFDLYTRSCADAGKREDPCLLDTYIAAVNFMNGGASTPWWAFTAQRKIDFPNL